MAIIVNLPSAAGVPAGTTWRSTIGACAANLVEGVAVTPGWTDYAVFLYVVANDAAPSGTLTRTLRATVIASTAALQVRVRLVRADTLVAVAGSTLTFAPPVDALEQTQETAHCGARRWRPVSRTEQPHARGHLPVPMKKPRRCRYYVVDLGKRAVYVGSTSTSPRERYARHKKGGKTSVSVVRKRGRGLIQKDLAARARSERELERELRRRGNEVRGGPRPFRPSRRRRG
jgi:hypothetical protein